MEEKQCAKCGQTLEPGARFCSICGNPMTPRDTDEAGATANSGNWRRDSLIMVALAVIVAIAYFGFRKGPEPTHTQNAPAMAGHESMPAEMPENLPIDYPSIVQMGNEFMDQGNYPMAAELYRRALEIDGSSADVRSDFGSCLHAMGLPQRALEEFRKIIFEHPDHVVVYFNLGIVFQGLGEKDSARYYWEKYLQLDPQGQPAEAARQYLKDMGT
jgi:tetratricopeptide (TPR) repeat protein